MKNRRRRQQHGSHDSTLLLNADYKPLFLMSLSTVSWKDAIISAFKNSVDIVYEHENWIVRSQHLEMKVPSVIAMKVFQKKEEKVRFCRKNLMLRDSYTCCHCGRDFSQESETTIQKYLTLDHVIPRSAGGPTIWENLQVLCAKCNHAKGARLDFMKPKIKPYKPTFNQLLPGYMKRHKIVSRDPRWMEFFTWPESNIIYIPPPDTR